MNLHEVNRGIKKHKRPNRKGRGLGSGQGKTAGRGHKGQRARAGFNQPAAFQGGASPLVRRIPKRGFHNAYALKVGIINLGDLNDSYEVGEEVTRESLKKKNLLKGTYDILKVLGNGELTKKLKVSAHQFSESARAKIEAAGGVVDALPMRVLVEDYKIEKKNSEKKQEKAGGKQK